jgi:hypothetical protein
MFHSTAREFFLNKKWLLTSEDIGDRVATESRNAEHE